MINSIKNIKLINNINLMDFIQKITNEGGELYLVGGTVRDRHYNKFFKTNIAPKDYDLLVCKLDLDKLEQILKEHGNIKEIGKAFGIITFRPIDSRISKYEFDIALPRKEKSTGPGYRDFEIVSDPFISIEEDLQRRDITANAIACRLYNINEMISEQINDEHIIDLFSGRDDLQNRIVRSVGDPYKRLLEDPTRIMRALRQSSQFNMNLHEDLYQAIIEHSDLLKIIINSSPVRISEELTRLLKTDNCGYIIEFMFCKTNIFKLLDINPGNNNVIEIIDKFTQDSINDVPIRVKFAILLKYSNIKQWVKKYELSAAPHFPKEDIKFLLMCQQGIDILEGIDIEYDDSGLKCIPIIQMNKFIQIVDKNYDQHLLDYATLWKYYDTYNPDIVCWIDNCKNIIRTTAEVKLGGVILQEKYKLKGKDIGNAKQWLFDEISNQKVKNDVDMLKLHFEKYYGSV